MMLIQFQKGSLFGNMHKVQIASQLETPLFDSLKALHQMQVGMESSFRSQYAYS